MKKLLPFFLVMAVCACSNNGEGEASSENEVDAARNFIRASLDGKWKDANRFMLPDSVNTQLLGALESNWASHMKREDKRGYREATINMYNTRKLSDSAVIVQYDNSYMKKRDSLKVLRWNNEWRVDLKFSFPQTDTANHVR